MRTPVALLAVLASTGCSHQVSPVEPGDIVYYLYAPAGSNQRPTQGQIKDLGKVLVGAPFDVNGVFAATCSHSTTPLGHDPDADRFPDSYSDCHEEETDVVITCRGACTVDKARHVTPTAAGPLVVDVALTSRKTGSHAKFSHELTAVAADRFELSCHPPAENGDLQCVTVTQGVTVRIGAGDATFAVPIRANGQEVAAPQQGAWISLPKIVGSPPGSPGETPSGEYTVELEFGPLRSVYTLVVEDPDQKKK